jgi:hypothetical protein
MGFPSELTNTCTRLANRSAISALLSIRFPTPCLTLATGILQHVMRLFAKASRRREVQGVIAAAVIVCMCAIACLCSRAVRGAEQSDGTKRPKFRILASWAVQTMPLLVKIAFDSNAAWNNQAVSFASVDKKATAKELLHLSLSHGFSLSALRRKASRSTVALVFSS